MNKQNFPSMGYLFMYAMAIGLLFLCTSCAVAKPTEIPIETFELQSYQPVPTNMPEISAIEGNAEIKLPTSAHEIYAYTTGMRDIFIMVRFSMDPNELPEFMSSTLCDQPLIKSKTLQKASENNFAWWTPDQAKYSEECFGEKGFSHQQIIVDMSDEKSFIVYVSTSTY